VFIDGPLHDEPGRAARDRAVAERLRDHSWDVVRFAHDADWAGVVTTRPNVFGTGAGTAA
jgi:hypothetical protein